MIIGSELRIILASFFPTPPPQEIVKYFSHYHSWICLYMGVNLPALLLGLLASQ